MLSVSLRTRISISKECGLYAFQLLQGWATLLVLGAHPAELSSGGLKMPGDGIELEGGKLGEQLLRFYRYGPSLSFLLL